MAEQRDNSGTVSANAKKSDPKHPDYKGNCTIGGVEYWVSGWNKVGSFGPFVSLAFEKKDTPANQRKSFNPQPVPGNFDDKDPF